MNHVVPLHHVESRKQRESVRHPNAPRVGAVQRTVRAVLIGVVLLAPSLAKATDSRHSSIQGPPSENDPVPLFIIGPQMPNVQIGPFLMPALHREARKMVNKAAGAFNPGTITAGITSALKAAVGNEKDN